MPLYFEIKKGREAGKKHPISDGLTLGRTAQLKLNDSKASSLHALVEENPLGEFVLKDNKSTNGIKVEGQRVESVILTEGLVVQIGRTYLQVIELKGELPPAPPEIELEPAHWDEFLGQFAKQKSQDITDPTAILKPFPMPLGLTFIRGLQIDTYWTLGYGPRLAGSTSFDLPIFEPDAPEVCFELIPHTTGVEFKTSWPQKVLLNGRPLSAEMLKSGDHISVGNTCIEVEFLP